MTVFLQSYSKALPKYKQPGSCLLAQSGVVALLNPVYGSSFLALGLGSHLMNVSLNMGPALSIQVHPI